MYIMIDNQDSFVYNIVSYMKILGKKVRVIQNNFVNIEEIDTNIEDIEGMIISPGPGNPDEYKNVKQLIKYYAGTFPIFLKCLKFVSYQRQEKLWQ